MFCFFFFKQKTAYEMRISDWSSDVCSSDLTFEILGIETKAVLGYEGKGPVQIAFQQGEINIDYQTTPAFNQLVRPQLEEGTAIPLYTPGRVADGQLVRAPASPAFPPFLAASREARARAPPAHACEA